MKVHWALVGYHVSFSTFREDKCHILLVELGVVYTKIGVRY